MSAALGLGLMLGYGGGMLAGGWLGDWCARRFGPVGKPLLCLIAMIAAMPAAFALGGTTTQALLIAVPIDFALAAVVTASGLSAIVDAAPATQRGAVTAISFFFNVAIDAGVGPGLVVWADARLDGGLAPRSERLGIRLLCRCCAGPCRVSGAESPPWLTNVSFMT